MSLTITMPGPYGLDLIKRYQGLSLEKYQDADGLWLIGYGHLISDCDVFDAPLTPAQADALFLHDVEYYRQVLSHCVQIPLTQNQFDALLSLAFSLGPESVQQSAIVDCINRGDVTAALKAWRCERGLAVQRQAEAALFETVILQDILMVK